MSETEKTSDTEASDPAASDPGARPVDPDAPEITQHVGEDLSTERAGASDEDYEQARRRAETTGATSFSVTTRRT